jgi:flagellar biosynthesis/type III secretory pathway protein FliH
MVDSFTFDKWRVYDKEDKFISANEIDPTVTDFEEEKLRTLEGDLFDLHREQEFDTEYVAQDQSEVEELVKPKENSKVAETQAQATVNSEELLREHYERGFSEGKKNSEDEFKNKLDTCRSELDQIIQDFEVWRTNQFASLEKSLTLFVLQVIKDLVRCMQQEHVEFINQMLETVLKEVSNKSGVTVNLPTHVYDLMLEDTIKKSTKAKSKITIQPDESIKTGCIVNAESEQLLFDPQAQLEKLLSLIRDV